MTTKRRLMKGREWADKNLLGRNLGNVLFFIGRNEKRECIVCDFDKVILKFEGYFG